MASLRDGLKWLLFELGAGYYARKLATGPEADLRREFLEFVSPPFRARVLDVGCGPHHLTQWLARRGCQATGVDRGWRLIRIAQRLAAGERMPVRFERSPAERLPFADASFDLAVATTVIYWVERPEAVLREMVRVTRPGGMVATLDPHASMNVGSVRAYCALQQLSRPDTRKLVAWAHASEHSRRYSEEELRAAGRLGACRASSRAPLGRAGLVRAGHCTRQVMQHCSAVFARKLLSLNLHQTMLLLAGCGPRS